MARMDVAAAAAVVISALSALGCSDPPDPPARGGLKIQFLQTYVVGETCTSSNGTFGVGDPAPEIPVPTMPESIPESIGLPIISGNDETTVSCFVSRNGDFRTTIKAPNISFDLRGNIQATATVSASAPSASLNVSGDGCTLQPVGFYPGEAYIKFDCPHAEKPSYPGIVCTLTGAVVALRCAEDG